MFAGNAWEKTAWWSTWLCKSITKQKIIDANKFSSGNQIADSILSEKSESAANIGTQIQFSGFISDEIPAVDLCTMLSNALDNAIEACEKLSLTDSAVITVKCAVVQNVQVIKLSNPNPDNKIPQKPLSSTKIITALGYTTFAGLSKSLAERWEYQSSSRSLFWNWSFQSMIKAVVWLWWHTTAL